MFVRQVKRKCSVRGCKCTDSFAISRTREVGNTVIICKSCLGKALGAIDEIDPKTKSNIPKTEPAKAPALFFNAQALGIASEPEVNDDAPVVPPEQPENSNEPEQDSGNPPAADSDDEPEQDADTDADTDADADTDGTASTDDVEDVTVFKCPICGKEFDSEKGLNAHLRYCKAKADEQ